MKRRFMGLGVRVEMSKGSNRRPQRVGDDVMADNWQQAFGDQWELKDLEGNVISSHSTYEKARNAGLRHFPVGQDFAVVLA